MKYVIISVIIIFCILFAINLADLNRYAIRSVVIYDSKVKKRCKVCFLSDVHNFALTPKFYEDIKEYGPDVILIGGDLINANPKCDNRNAYDALSKLSEISPTYLAMGNHEYRAGLYRDVYGDLYDVLSDCCLKNDVKLLVNDTIELGETGVVVSSVQIDRSYYKRFKKQFMPEDYIESLTGKPDSDKYNILLAHNPDYFERYNTDGRDLILSGHVHGGLIRLPVLHGVAHPGFRFFPKFSGGVFSDKGKFVPYSESYVSNKNNVIRLIVSCGIGFHTLPLRLFNPGELIFVTLENK